MTEPIASDIELQPTDDSEDVRSEIKQIAVAQEELLAGFERLASAVSPLLTRQFNETEQRMRQLEKRILQRQERPTVHRLMQLLVDVQRIDDDGAARAHANDGILQILEQLGYTPFGSLYEPYDEAKHEALAGTTAQETVVTKLFAQGFAAYGDVILRARVEVGPRPADESLSYQPKELQ